MIVRYPALADEALESAGRLGLNPDLQRRLGGFTFLWTLFETQLEFTLWEIAGQPAPDTRPFTDKTSIDAWIKQLAKGSTHLSAQANRVVASLAAAAEDLMHYRHAVAHGHIVPSEAGPSFLRNPSWGQVKRGRPPGEAHLDTNLANMALASILIIIRATLAVKEAHMPLGEEKKVLAAAGDVASAQSWSNELRHLSELMNDERY